MDLVDAFSHGLTREPTRTAVRDTGGRSLRYTELDGRASALANALDERIPGERCASLLDNGVPAVETVLAAHKRGLANVQLFTRGAPDELAAMIASADPAGFVYDRANAELAEAVLERVDLEAVLAVGTDPVEGAESYADAVDGAAAERSGDPAGPEAAVFYTSGTTGVPKGILYEQEQLWLGTVQTLSETGLTPDDTGLVLTPWYHMFTYTNAIMPHLHVGGSLVVQGSFDPEGALRAIEDHDVDNVIAVPTQLRDMVEVQREQGYDLGSLQRIRTGGAPTNRELVERIVDHLGGDLRVLYGFSEGGATVTHSYPYEQYERPETVGKAALMWQLRVVEPADPPEKPDSEAVVEPGGTGEVLVRGPAMATGYLDNPAAEEALFVDGWIRTGDVADTDEDGYLYIVDRVDNMIVSGGENVYPQEVERVLAEHPAVDDVCVVGIAHERWGRTVAAVVLTDGSVDEDDLDDFCREHPGLGDYKRPRRYAFADGALPRTASGTLPRAEIRDRFFE